MSGMKASERISISLALNMFIVTLNKHCEGHGAKRTSEFNCSMSLSALLRSLSLSLPLFV